MKEQQTNSNELRNVFYWEYVFNVSFKQVEEMLDSKHEYLKSLKYQLYQEMNEEEDLINQIRLLEDEMSRMITLIDTTEHLKMAYVNSTANNASLLIKLSTENLQWKNEKIELENQIEGYRIFSNILAEKAFLCWKGGCHE
jgi:hypothetical protein